MLTSSQLFVFTQQYEQFVGEYGTFTLFFFLVYICIAAEYTSIFKCFAGKSSYVISHIGCAGPSQNMSSHS